LREDARLILYLRLQSERLDEARQGLRESRAIADALCAMDHLSQEQEAELDEQFQNFDTLESRIARLTRLQMTVVDALQSLAAPRPDLMGFVSLLRLHTHQYSEAMKRRDEARRLGDSLDARGLSHDQDELAAELEERADRLQGSRAELILEIIDEMTAATAANRVDPLLTKRKRGRPPGPTRAQMLDDLRSGRISPEQLANLKDEALGAEYRVPKTTAVEARNRALAEFDGNSR
jgi:hypothetical protein